MNFGNRFLHIFLLTILFSVSTLASFGKSMKFASKMKEAIEKVQQEAKKNPDTFKANVALLEKEWGERKNPVEQSVVHALLGSAYAEMTWTSITDFDEETRHDYEQKRNEHFSHVLDDMEALADAKSSGYKEFMEEGEDAVLFENDMLSVMIAFVENEARWDNYRLLDAYEKVAQLYRMRGNQNACALMKLKAWNLRRRVEKKYGRISAEQYKDSVYQLLQEVKDEEVGADVAMEYASSLSSRCEIFLFLQWAKENVAKSRCSKNLQNMEDMLLRPEVQFHTYGKTVLLAGKPSTLQFEYWNCDRFTLTVRHYTGGALNKDGEKTLREDGAVVEEKEIVFGTDVKNAERKAKGLPVEGVSEAELTLPVGRYVLVAKSDWGKSVQEVRVTSLHVMIQEKDKENVLVYVVDNVTGRPVEGVKVQCRKSLPNTGERTDGWESQNVVQEVLTNAEGVAEVKANMQIRAVKDERDYTEYIKPSVWKNYVQENIQKTCRVMTERGIYRPGQVLKGTVFVYIQEGVEAKVAAEESVVLKAQDSQGKDVALLHLVTNEYGTASFELSLPEDCALGNLALQTEVAGQSSNTTVKVEEYKRPNFDVTLEGKKAGRFGQNLEVEGRAMLLAGVPLQGASVHYVVECEATPFRWWLGNDREEWNLVAEGELVTDEKGEFLIPLFLTDEYRKDDRLLVRFRVKALVTDMSGETHEGEWGINVSDEEYVLETDVANVVDLAKDGTFKVEAYNANREKVDLQGDFQILHADKVVATGRFTANEKTELPEGLRLGVHYALVASVVDGRGRKVENRKEFIAYSSDLPATDFSALGFKEKFRENGDLSEEDFFVTGSLDFEEGGTVDLYFSTQETDAYIICNVYGIDGLIESYAAVTDGTMQHIRLQHRKEWGESIFIQMMYVRNGHFFSQSRTLVIAAPEKELKLEWATFRDKLQPGQQEQWRLTVTDRDGKRVSGAEMMAVLYDAALDRICPHDWYFRLYYYHPTPFSTCVHASGKFSWFGLDGTRQNATPYVRTFDTLRGFVHDRFVRGFGAAVPMGKSAGVDMALRGRIAGLQLNVLEENAVVTMESEEEATMDFENAAIRNDFAETAFFLPHLVSDQDGVVDVQFTLPESLTEWRFLGFAHTKDVDYGTIKASAVARKNFMLRPNMPRFVHWGDGVVLSSSIVNQSELAQKGSVRLRLIDSGTGEVVFEEERPFFVEAAQTDVVEFEFEVREGWNDLDCEIVAVSGNVSDGEKNRLPVLSTKQEVVEAVPFYVMGVEDGAVEKTVNLSALYNGQSSTATNRDLKVEYTDNPVWMCIEALRSVRNPANDNAIDFAVSLCANARLLNLMETFPMLEKYEDKAELLQRMQMAENKLFGLQQADGGWSWFKGMDGNYYITLAVCEMLSEMGALNERVEEMLKQGMVFLDKQELENYRNRLRLGQEIISESAIRYLSLVASQPQRPIDRELQKMHRKYLSLLEKKRDALTIYGVAKAACLLRQFQREKSADKFVDLLKEYMVEKPGQGRFFASDAAYYSWMDYRIPTQVAAIKAISQRNRKDACLTDMVLWLVAQKQVQKWDNPLNAIDIAEVLLHISPTEMFFTAEMPRMSIDGVPLTRMEVGTINKWRDELEGRDAELAMQGRVLADVPAEMLDKGVDSLTISKATPGISWGAAYATFVEDIEQLKPYRTDELKIQRKIYVQSAAGGEWTVWKEGNSLHVGDRLKIRHMVSADRDMDFVKLSAQHPACLEPVRQLSGYQPLGGRSGYLSVRDAGFDVFFDKFTRGTSTVDVEYYIVREGAYEVGISTVECEYAKQFGGHTGGQKVKSIKNERNMQFLALQRCPIVLCNAAFCSE